ncbi:glutamate receptor ionotropic, kainate 2-like isoform X2 [Varroa destructor]|uniref:Uncharacterized protein n=1 Tax=Varroa destructor TaxID=109461 RepID=A0A7M7JKN8_VARDE|nr:glutamate receptor ionotropic, kainate 2-like isoform X2 [Varroa destructor]
MLITDDISMLSIRSIILFLVVTLFAGCVEAGQPFSVNIGGIFASNSPLVRVFDFAIRRAPESSRLPIVRDAFIGMKKVIPDIHSSFDASKAVCQLLSRAPSIVVGPTVVPVSHILASTCRAFHVPFLSIGPLLSRTSAASPRKLPQMLNLHPPSDILGRAYFDVLNMTEWRSLTIVYDREDAFLRLAPILRAAPSLTTLRPLDKSVSPGTLFKEVLRSKDTHIVLDVDTQLIPELLRSAKDVGLMTEYHNFVITSLDLHTLDLSPFFPSRANITFLQLLDLKSKENLKMIRDFRRFQLMDGIRDNLNLTTEQALLIDSVSFVVRTLYELSASSKLRSPPPFKCQSPRPWQTGDLVIKKMLRSSFRGVTGIITLNRHGLRSRFQVNVMRIMWNGVAKIATWNQDSGIRTQASYPATFRKELENLMASKVFNVTTIVSDYRNRTGNDRFEGFCMELMETLAANIGFRYSVHLVKDNSYGSRQPDGTFDGMIKELINMEADMAIVDLSITAERMQAVDFTQPFLKTGISILFRKPAQGGLTLFLFMKPFSIDVWICMLTAFTGVTVLYYLIASISPTENRDLGEDDLSQRDPQLLDQEMKIMSRFWFTIGSIMQQGCDLNPVSLSCRTIASIWWFFTLIVVSSYTASLAATLTAERLVSSIDSADDLARQSTIEYGCLASGSSRKFFEQSTNRIYQQLADHMDRQRPSVHAKTNDEGVRRVLAGNYAYFMEATTIEYRKERDCRLTMVGGLLDSKGYGIATPVGSPMRKLLSKEIVRLGETDYFMWLKERWWKATSPCPEMTPPSEEMGMRELAGVFLVLAVGALLGIIMMMGEFLWEATSIPYGQRALLIVELFWTLRYAIWGKDKRPRPKGMQSYFVSARPDAGRVGDIEVYPLDYEDTSVYSWRCKFNTQKETEDL